MSLDEVLLAVFGFVLCPHRHRFEATNYPPERIVSTVVSDRKVREPLPQQSGKPESDHYRCSLPISLAVSSEPESFKTGPGKLPDAAMKRVRGFKTVPDAPREPKSRPGAPRQDP